MKKPVLSLCIIYLSLAIPLLAADTTNRAGEGTPAPRQENEGASNPVEKGKDADKDKDGKKESANRNFNVDATVLYGQYNRLLWSGSITQSFENFTYQLNSDFNRSNDFGYKNSSYFTNEIGFTGDADITSKWRLTPSLEVKNDSYGMFRNPFYEREEKDKVDLKFMNDFKTLPTRWTLNIGGVYFIHRLDSYLYPDLSTVMPYHSSDFYKVYGELGWQYIWSAANKLSFSSTFAEYRYSTSSHDDTWSANEFIWNFNISEYFKFGLGPMYTYNRDGGHFVSGKINVATVNIKYFSAEASYLYELIPFKPENFYLDQRYVKPDYGLLPGKGHHADLNLGLDVSTTSDKKFYVRNLKIKAAGTFITNDRFYAFFSLPQMVQLSHQMRMEEASGKFEASIGFAIYTAFLDLGGKYEYSYFYASDYVTYQPVHLASGSIRLTVYRFETEFKTTYRGRVHVSPFFNTTMGPVLIGSLSLQFKVLESFYLFGRIDNIYNRKYSTVPGYPEQGRSIVAGLRIII